MYRELHIELKEWKEAYELLFKQYHADRICDGCIHEGHINFCMQKECLRVTDYVDYYETKDK